MLCFRDMTFCRAVCGNYQCDRRYTRNVVKSAEIWWGGRGAPIAVADMTQCCSVYVPIVNQKAVDEWGKKK